MGISTGIATLYSSAKEVFLWCRDWFAGAKCGGIYETWLHIFDAGRMGKKELATEKHYFQDNRNDKYYYWGMENIGTIIWYAWAYGTRRDEARRWKRRRLLWWVGMKKKHW